MSRLVERAGMAAFHRLDPETAHGLSLKALNAGLAPLPGPVRSSRLAVDFCGMTLANPIGLAAGFDKNATALNALGRAGFGFLEVGAATPHPQPGNPKPRLFRLSHDKAVINRFGFNNDGMNAIGERLAVGTPGIPVGLNLGANKDSTDRAGDFALVLKQCGPNVDFATVNVSSPNTEKLRDLQGSAALRALLDGVMDVRQSLQRPIPIFLKIAPDLSDDELSEITEVAEASGVDAIVATNTTLNRNGLKDAQKLETGGLSGAPLFERSTRILAKLSIRTTLPLIGVGGVASADQAYAKIAAGASVVQLYSGMVYGGLSLAPRIAQDLDDMLRRAGITSIGDVVGTDRDRWL
ncbi:MAG: quinone-dependent dihydroorotate dehydrogenase [Litoreibacter sp.]